MVTTIVGGLIFLVMIFGWGVPDFLKEWHKRNLRHAERMKALELWRDLPHDEAMARLEGFYQVQKAQKSEDLE